METLVMKFGGASVARPEQFSKIAEIIIQRSKVFSRLVIVVSAMGQTTDHLIDLAKQVNPQPPQREYDMLISVGERISMSLLAMALCHQKKEAVSFTGSQSGIMTCSNHANARIIDVKPARIVSSLDEGKIVIVAGFQGVSLKKEITTLGRGGSDTTAVALALALGGYAEFYKDVKGIHDKDPKQHADALLLTRLTYQDALDVVNKGARVMHSRAIELAQKNGMPLFVRSFMTQENPDEGTWITDPQILRKTIPVYESDLTKK